MFHRNEFTIHEHVLDSKTTCAIDSLHVLGSLHELLDLAINDVLSGGEVDVITYSCEEWNFVDEEKVARQSHVLICRHDCWRNCHVVGNNR